MILLAEFNVIKPDYGLFFWTVLIFVVLWTFLGKKAFRPIANALKDREDSIREALASAETAKAEMANLQSQNEGLLVQAREERTKLLNEARDASSKLISEAKHKAKDEAGKIMSSANMEIENQKRMAIQEVKNQAGLMALQVAENLLRKNLSNDQTQRDLAKSLADDIKLN